MDSFQKYLNRMLGISDEAWEQYSPEGEERKKRIQAISLKIDALEGSVNELLAVVSGENVREVDIQKSINKIMGISDETWKKYN
jgi:hypothetical protein